MANRLYAPNQQFADTNGLPYAGGTLTFYATGSSTPLNTYSDSVLTIPNTNPVTLDSAGRAGSVFLQNVAYKVVLADKSGNQIWSMDPVYGIDATSVSQFQVFGGNPNGSVAGTAGAGTTPSSAVWDNVNNVLYVCTTTGTTITAVWTNVTSTSGFITGDVKWRASGELITGWVRCNALSVGNAVSGATERANADANNLFSYLWNNFADAQCPVSTGRGGSAAADFSANKTITILDMRSLGPMGVDTMGNGAAGLLATVPFVSGNSVTPGSTAGENLHALTTGELAAHNHGVTDPNHTHTVNNHTTGITINNAATGVTTNNASTGVTTNSATTGISVNSHSTGITGTNSATTGVTVAYDKPSVAANNVNTTGAAALISITGGSAATVTDPGHTHTITDPNHIHAITDAGHTHAITDPQHNHGITDPQHNHAITDAGHIHTAVAAATGITTNNAGSGTSHNTVQRSMLGTWFIKL